MAEEGEEMDLDEDLLQKPISWRRWAREEPMRRNLRGYWTPRRRSEQEPGTTLAAIKTSWWNSNAG